MIPYLHSAQDFYSGSHFLLRSSKIRFRQILSAKAGPNCELLSIPPSRLSLSLSLGALQDSNFGIESLELDSLRSTVGLTRLSLKASLPTDERSGKCEVGSVSFNGVCVLV
ncbi:hypothetical protein PM082_021138 [Marasmius tenuissimus]|nr:hypothetical protein PM082_021138 [Marasmius tenuissimus]